MRISCRRDDLRTGLHGTLPGAAVRGESVLNHVHIEATSEALVLTTYNRLWWMRKAVPADIHEVGVVIVPARLITELIDAWASDSLDLSISSNEADLRIIGADGEVSVRAGIAKMFPQFPDLDSAFTARIEAFGLLRAVQLASVAAAASDGGPLSGLHMTFANGDLVVAASDSARLAERTVDASSDDEPIEFTVPATAVRQLNDLMAGETGLVTLTVATKRNLASFGVGGSVLITSTIDGDYPSYRQLIPTDGVVRSRVGRERLLAQLRAALLLSPPEGKRIRIQVSGKDRLVVTSEGSQLGSGRLEVSASNDPGPAEVFVDGSAIKDGLEAMDSRSVDLFIGHDRHLVIRPSDRTDELYLVVHKRRPPSADFRS
jgi:DNA polymerase-3 subunit beta